MHRTSKHHNSNFTLPLNFPTASTHVMLLDPNHEPLSTATHVPIPALISILPIRCTPKVWSITWRCLVPHQRLLIVLQFVQVRQRSIVSGVNRLHVADRQEGRIATGGRVLHDEEHLGREIDLGRFVGGRCVSGARRIGGERDHVHGWLGGGGFVVGEDVRLEHVAEGDVLPESWC